MGPDVGLNLVLVAVIVSLAVIGRHAATVLGEHARHMLELDGGVVNVKCAQHIVDALQNAFARRRGHVFD